MSAGERERTVTKCPACDKVTTGTPERCPGCGHLFSDLAKTLPVVCEGGSEPFIRVVRDESARTRGIPRHVAVPVLAGLLVAVMVLVFLRMSGTEHRGTSSPNRTGDKASGTQGPSGSDAAQPAGNVAAKRNEGAEGLEQTSTAALQLGPGVKRILPIETRFLRYESGTSPQGDVLLDSNLSTCYSPWRSDRDRQVSFRFASSLRISHVVVHVNCLTERNHEAVAEAAIVADDGSRRVVRLHERRGPVSVDLAGAWTSNLLFEFDMGELAGVGLGEVEFFAFDD